MRVVRYVRSLYLYVPNENRESLLRAFVKKIRYLWYHEPPNHFDEFMDMISRIAQLIFDVREYERIIEILYRNASDWDILLFELLSWSLAVYHYIFTESDIRRIILASRRPNTDSRYSVRLEWAVLNLHPSITVDAILDDSIQFTHNYNISNIAEDTMILLLQKIPIDHELSPVIYTHLLDNRLHHLLGYHDGFFQSALDYYQTNQRLKEYYETLGMRMQLENSQDTASIRFD